MKPHHVAGLALAVWYLVIGQSPLCSPSRVTFDSNGKCKSVKVFESFEACKEFKDAAVESTKKDERFRQYFAVARCVEVEDRLAK